MIDDALFANLQKFGLTQYEAKAYVALLSIGLANAYQVGKASGIPRTRIYDILDALVTRGVVMSEETSDGTKKYTALPAGVLLEQVREDWTTAFGHVERELKRLEAQEKKRETYVSSVRGESNILAYCRNLVRGARRKVIVSIWDTMYAELATEFQAAHDRGCRIAGVTFNVEQPLPSLDQHGMSKLHTSLDNKKWFILAVDSEKLLYGHSAEYDGNAFYTEDSTHIYLLEDYIFHDVLVNHVTEKEDIQKSVGILLAEVLGEMKDRFLL